MASSRDISDPSPKRRPPGKTRKAREDQMVSLAVDLAEKQLREGTASTQVIVHYLKLATLREEAEREELELRKSLLKSRSDNIKAATNQEEMAKLAYDAFRGYQGLELEDEDDDY